MAISFKKEVILEAIKAVLAEAKAYDVETSNGTKTVKSFASDAEANDFKMKNTNIKSIKALEEDDHLDSNDESDMAKSQLYAISRYSIELLKMIQDGEQLDAWVQAKITKAADYIDAVQHYMEGEKYLASTEAPGAEDEPMNEKLDPVGEEDKDVNNDGKVDKTDKYLKNRRVSISKAMAQGKKK